MSLSIGIVGLPNVGKSTTFNALTGAQNAEVASYPFCTIQPNRAIVPLPDQRLERLAELVNVDQIIHSTVEFFDIAGLVKGASQGEGLGNQFLGNIRDVSAILHIVRCFSDPNIPHVSEEIDPVSDIEIINLELVLADLQQLERKIEKLSTSAKWDKTQRPILETAQSLKEHLSQGKQASGFSQVDTESYRVLNQELRFLTGKPILYLANVDEDGVVEGNPYVDQVREYAGHNGAGLVLLCAQLEQDMQGMDTTDRQEYLELLGIDESGLAQVVRKSFGLLGLISFFTFNDKQTRSWNVPEGTTAPKAAGAIQTDFERGFIRAEVIPFEVFDQYGGSAAVKAAGLMRLEGKDYVVQDGDVIYFRFNV